MLSCNVSLNNRVDPRRVLRNMSLDFEKVIGWNRTEVFYLLNVEEANDFLVVTGTIAIWLGWGCLQVSHVPGILGI
jgi:hypothetical protein